MIGKEISAILEIIEENLWKFDETGKKPNYPLEGFRASIKIFMSIMMDKMWELQGDEQIDIQTRVKMAQKLGEDIRKLVKIYTDIDTHDLYK